MNYELYDSMVEVGGHTRSFMPDGMTSALGWIGFGLIMLAGAYLLIRGKNLK